MLRLAVWRLCEAGIVPVMLIHDGILLELGNEDQMQAIEIMAGREVCNGFEIGVDIDQKLEHGRCPLARKMWATMMDALATVKAVPRKAGTVKRQRKKAPAVTLIR